MQAIAAVNTVILDGPAPAGFNTDHTGGCAHLHQKADGQLGGGGKHQSCNWGWKEVRARGTTMQITARQEAKLRNTRAPTTL